MIVRQSNLCDVLYNRKIYLVKKKQILILKMGYNQH